MCPLTIRSTAGSMMARRFARTNVLEISFAGFTWMMFFMIALYSMLNGAMWVLGYDPTWAGTKASMACMKISWMDIYRDMLVENTVRASGFVLGIYDNIVLYLSHSNAFMTFRTCHVYATVIHPPRCVLSAWGGREQGARKEGVRPIKGWESGLRKGWESGLRKNKCAKVVSQLMLRLMYCSCTVLPAESQTLTGDYLFLFWHDSGRMCLLEVQGETALPF